MTNEFQAAELAQILDELTTTLDKIPDSKLADDLLQTFNSKLKHLLKVTDGTPLSMMTVEDLLEGSWPEPDWVVDDILPVGLTLFAGRPKVGKTRLAMQLAHSVASGTTFMNRAVSQGPVAIFALEDPPRRLRQTLVAQGWTSDLPVDFMTAADFEVQLGNLHDEGLNRLERQIAEKKYRLVIIDTVSRAIPGKQKEVEEMNKALIPLHDIAHETECAVMLIDHHRKNIDFAPDAHSSIDDILGSTAKGAISDTIWGLYHKKGNVSSQLLIVGREVIETTITLQKENETGLWQTDGSAHGLRMTARRQEAVDFISENPNLTSAEIADALDQDRGNTHKRLQDLVTHDVIAAEEILGVIRYTPSTNGQSI